MSLSPSATGPESIVTSLDWSKKLKEAGWPQDDSYLFWCRHPISPEPNEWELGKSIIACLYPDTEFFAAPTAEEILRRLPRYLASTGGLNMTLTITPYADKWTVEYLLPELGYDNSVLPQTHVSLANAAAAMYCYLAEQKLLPKAA